MGLAIRIATGLAALGLAGSVAACSSSTTPSGVVSSASSALSSASSFASSAASSVSSAASSLNNSSSSSGGGLSGNVSIPSITGGNTKIEFDQNYLTALKTLNLTPTGTGQAQVSGNTATFPVTGGSFTLSGSTASGTIQHAGGIKLGSGATAITLDNFVLDPAANKMYGDIMVAGQTAGSHVGLFDISSSGASVQGSSGSATISGLKLTLSNDAASALNKAMNTTAIQGNFPVGTATVTLQGSGSSSSASPSTS